MNREAGRRGGLLSCRFSNDKFSSPRLLASLFLICHGVQVPSASPHTSLSAAAHSASSAQGLQSWEITTQVSTQRRTSRKHWPDARIENSTLFTKSALR